MVLIIDRTVMQSETARDKSTASIAELVSEFEAKGLDHRAALKKVARELGLSRDQAYRRLVAERGRE